MPVPAPDPAATQGPVPAALARTAPPLVGVAAFVIVIVGLSLAAGVVSMILLSVLVAILVAPIASAVRRRGWPGWAALLLALASYVLVLAVFGIITAVGVFRLLRELPADTSDLTQILGVDLGDSQVADTLARAFAGVLTTLAQGALSSLAVVGYSVIVVAYLLLEAPTARDRLLWAFGSNPVVVERAGALVVRLRAYLIARAALGGAAAILDTIVLIVLGIPSAFLWGVLSFLLSFVPNVGFILSMIPPAVLGLVVGGWPTALAVVISYSVINVTVDYLVQPRFVGSAVDLSPLVVTVSLLFWALVLGGAGAIFAVPLTIIVVGVADAFDGTRPLSRMLAANVPRMIGFDAAGERIDDPDEAPVPPP